MTKLIRPPLPSAKIFTTPNRADFTQYRELLEFPLLDDAPRRLSQPPLWRYSEDSLFLERVRRAIGGPTSLVW